MFVVSEINLYREEGERFDEEQGLLRAIQQLDPCKAEYFINDTTVDAIRTTPGVGNLHAAYRNFIASLQTELYQSFYEVAAHNATADCCEGSLTLLDIEPYDTTPIATKYLAQAGDRIKCLNLAAYLNDEEATEVHVATFNIPLNEFCGSSFTMLHTVERVENGCAENTAIFWHGGEQPALVKSSSALYHGSRLTPTEEFVRTMTSLQDKQQGGHFVAEVFKRWHLNIAQIITEASDDSQPVTDTITRLCTEPTRQQALNAYEHQKLSLLGILVGPEAQELTTKDLRNLQRLVSQFS